MGKFSGVGMGRRPLGPHLPDHPRGPSRSDGSLKGYIKGPVKPTVDVFSEGLRPVPGSADEERWFGDAKLAAAAAAAAQKAAQEQPVGRGFAVGRSRADRA